MSGVSHDDPRGCFPFQAGFWSKGLRSKMAGWNNIPPNVYAHSPEECEEKLGEWILRMKAEIAQIIAEPGKQERTRVRNFRTRVLLKYAVKLCRKGREKEALSRAQDMQRHVCLIFRTTSSPTTA